MVLINVFDIYYLNNQKFCASFFHQNACVSSIKACINALISQCLSPFALNFIRNSTYLINISLNSNYIFSITSTFTVTMMHHHYFFFCSFNNIKWFEWKKLCRYTYARCSLLHTHTLVNGIIFLYMYIIKSTLYASSVHTQYIIYIYNSKTGSSQ